MARIGPVRGKKTSSYIAKSKGQRKRGLRLRKGMREGVEGLLGVKAVCWFKGDIENPNDALLGESTVQKRGQRGRCAFSGCNRHLKGGGSQERIFKDGASSKQKRSRRSQQT